MTRRQAQATLDLSNGNGTNGNGKEPTFTSAADTEQWLNDHHVKWELKWFPLSQINVTKSHANQARDTAVKQELSDRYTVAIKAGAKMPPLVGSLVGKHVVLIDGNNRFDAHKRAGDDGVWVYVVDKDTPELLVKLLTWQANVDHGEAPSVSIRQGQAMTLINLGAYTQEQAAHHLRLTPHQLKSALKVEEGTKRALKLKLRVQWHKLSMSSKEKLAGLDLDPVFEAAVRMVADTDMKSEVQKFVADLKKLPSETEKLRLVEWHRTNRGADKAAGIPVRKRNSPVRNPRGGVQSGLGLITAISIDQHVALWETHPDRDEMANRYERAAVVCMEAEERLRALGDK